MNDECMCDAHTTEAKEVRLKLRLQRNAARYFRLLGRSTDSDVVKRHAARRRRLKARIRRHETHFKFTVRMMDIRRAIGLWRRQFGKESYRDMLSDDDIIFWRNIPDQDSISKLGVIADSILTLTLIFFAFTVASDWTEDLFDSVKEWVDQFRQRNATLNHSYNSQEWSGQCNSNFKRHWVDNGRPCGLCGEYCYFPPDIRAGKLSAFVS